MKRTVAAILILFASFSFVPTVILARWPLGPGGYDFTIDNMILSASNSIEINSTLMVEGKIENTGSATGSCIVTLIITYPNGTTTQPDERLIRDIQVGEAMFLTLIWNSTGNPSGKYSASLNVSAPDGTHKFDMVNLSFNVHSPPDMWATAATYFSTNVWVIIPVAFATAVSAHQLYLYFYRKKRWQKKN